jgi:hypothetical protein
VDLQDQLNADLERRLRALDEPPHATSECMQTSRPIFIEALAWIAGALIIWILSVILL